MRFLVWVIQLDYCLVFLGLLLEIREHTGFGNLNRFRWCLKLWLFINWLGRFPNIKVFPLEFINDFAMKLLLLLWLLYFRGLFSLLNKAKSFRFLANFFNWLFNRGIFNWCWCFLVEWLWVELLLFVGITFRGEYIWVGFWGGLLSSLLDFEFLAIEHGWFGLLDWYLGWWSGCLIFLEHST